MIGLLTTPLALWIILLIFSFLTNSLVFNTAARFMEFTNKTWKTSMLLSLYTVLFTAIYSAIITFLKIFSIIIQILGIVLFALLIYYLTQRIYKNETKRQKIEFSFFATLFALLLNSVLLIIISLLNNVFSIV
ncbi:hypothetical protein DRJ22_04980 [Candidatus Woesearchaeota archaeon]|nr:MAG: hypothetical protein DRJ22_04980 [Candidatus Woesearchaeota archaeon]